MWIISKGYGIIMTDHLLNIWEDVDSGETLALDHENNPCIISDNLVLDKIIEAKKNNAAFVEVD